MADIMEKFWSAPPVTRTLVAAMLVESALIHGGVVSGYRVILHTPWIFKFPPELWRLLSSFLLTGGGFSMVFDLYFTWIYAGGLELKSSRFSQPGDFCVYVIFVATVILVTAGFLLKAMVLTSSLMLAFIYTFAQDNRGQKAHFVLFQIPVELLPWAMLGLTLILGGPMSAIQQGTGVVAAHLYDFLTRLYPTFQGGRNIIQTPTAVRNFFSVGQARSTNRGYGQAFRPVQPNQQQPTRGWTSGFTGSWGGRGSGRRLGGD